MITDVSSFYYESGGQIFDTGALVSSNNVVFQVTNAQTYAGYVVHSGTITSGTLKVGDEVSCQVDYTRRAYVAPNHTMTHVLNYALRTVLIDASKDAENLSAAGLCEQKGHSLIHAYSLTLTHSLTLSHSLTLTHSLLLPHSLTLSLPTYYSLTLTYLTHLLLTHLLLTHAYSLTHAYRQSR